MTIKIIRNDNGNCINFVGSSNPVYFNACLSAEVDDRDATLVNVINDIHTAETGSKEYEFYNIPYTEFEDKDGYSFADAAEAAEYITENGNVATVQGVIDRPANGFAPVWVTPDGELRAGTEHNNREVFTNVDSVVIDYSDLGRQPNLTVFTVDVYGNIHETFPSIIHDEASKSVLVSFGSAQESGYIVVN